MVMSLISSKPQVLHSSLPYKLVMPEREVGVCSADEGQQALNSCPELCIFSLGITWYYLLMYIHTLTNFTKKTTPPFPAGGYLCIHKEERSVPY